MSIRARVTLFGLAVVAAVLFVVSLVFYGLIAGTGQQNQDRQLAARAASAVASLASAPVADLAPRRPLAPANAAETTEIVVVVTDADGAALSADGLLDGRIPPVPSELRRRASAEGTAVATAWPLRVHVRPWHRADLGRSGYVMAAQTVRRLATDRMGVVALIVISDLVALLAAAVAIFFAVGRALRPLRELTATADTIGRSADLSRRLPPVRQRDAVGRLTASFNAMMDRLQAAHRWLADALATQQRFTADASHELRTPLTTIRGNVGFLRSNPDAAADDRDAALADLDSESARMSRLVDDLLTLARADGGQRLELSTVDVGALAAEVVRQARGLHPDRELHCVDAPVTVTGDEEALRRLMWILIDNAVAHTDEGGRVWVSVTRHGTGASLEVADDGTGIPPGLEARVFDRFFRADAARARGGTGLGLSIAQWIVWAHGGRISAANNARGGASFVAELPGVAAPDA